MNGPGHSMQLGGGRSPLGRHALARRRLIGSVAALGAGLAARRATSASEGTVNRQLNAPATWPVVAGSTVTLTVDAAAARHAVDKRVFGTNLEWFNDAGGFADGRTAPELLRLARDSGATVFRFPGGILADYYRWVDGIGAVDRRPTRKHPTDPGSSRNNFGSPELFRLTQDVGAEALLTVNAGTATASEAADWVAYCNRAGDARRQADGFKNPIGVRLWEIGNELYLPGNPHEVKIGVAPEVYAERFVKFTDAMRAVDPTLTAIGIGVAPRTHVGPDSAYPEWSEVLLRRAASRLDMLSVHNAYFPFLFNVVTPPIEVVYPALWAAPDAVERSLEQLDRLVARHEGQRKTPIGIAVTEWGALFSLPQIDPYWTDHVKTLGSAVYVARMLQVLVGQPRVKLANHFKLADRSFMGAIGYDGRPKLPFHAFRLLATHTGSQVVEAAIDNVPTYDTPGIGAVAAQRNVPELTVLATRDQTSGRLFVNLVNRSIRRTHTVKLVLKGMRAAPAGRALSLSGPEPTTHGGRDIPPEWPYQPGYEPYSSAPAGAIGVQSDRWDPQTPLAIRPFSVVTLVIDEATAVR